MFRLTSLHLLGAPVLLGAAVLPSASIAPAQECSVLDLRPIGYQVVGWCPIEPVVVGDDVTPHGSSLSACACRDLLQPSQHTLTCRVVLAR